MPLLCLKVGLRKYDHADDRLDIVGDAGTCDDQPSNDAQHADDERQEVAVLFVGYDIGKVVLSCSSVLTIRCWKDDERDRLTSRRRKG